MRAGGGVVNLICGIHPVLEALAAGTRHFDRLLIVKGIRNARISEAIARASQLGVPLRFESRETLDRMAGEIPHQGVIAVVSAKPTIALEELIREHRDPALIMVLDGVEDPRNLGAILRTAEAAGVDGVVLPERHSAGLSETVSRSSAGGLEHVRVARVGNVAQALGRLKEAGFWVVGFDASGSERWDAVDYRPPIALVLGGEGRGIRRLVRESCDHLVALPLFGHVASLNVSVAAGIALYEVIRQRGAVPSHVRPIPVRAAAPVRQVVGPDAHDAEHDPGRERTGRPWAGSAQENGGEDEHAAPPPRVLDIPDEAAWTGPMVVKARPSGRRFGSGWQGRRHGKKHGPRGRGGPRDHAGAAAPREPGPHERPQDGHQGGDRREPLDRAAIGPRPEHPRERRRRGRRRRGPRPGPPGTAAGGPPASSSAGPDSPPEGPPGPPRAQGPGGNHRRRRRRRRR